MSYYVEIESDKYECDKRSNVWTNRWTERKPVKAGKGLIITSNYFHCEGTHFMYKTCKYIAEILKGMNLLQGKENPFFLPIIVSPQHFQNEK